VNARWIRVTERLPEIVSHGWSAEVWTASSDGRVTALYYNADGNWYDAELSEEALIDNVTHWMTPPAHPDAREGEYQKMIREALRPMTEEEMREKALRDAPGMLNTPLAHESSVTDSTGEQAVKRGEK
jgi:hypothetical protein